jgi:hypothetical protein
MRGREENLAAAMRTHTFAGEKISPFFLHHLEVSPNLTQYRIHSMFRGQFVTELVPSLVQRRGAQT